MVTGSHYTHARVSSGKNKIKTNHNARSLFMLGKESTWASEWVSAGRAAQFWSVMLFSPLVLYHYHIEGEQNWWTAYPTIYSIIMENLKRVPKRVPEKDTKNWLRKVVCIKTTLLALVGHTSNQHPPACHEGWMVSDQETVFCWVSVP
jgi:hypothetical protein